MTTRSFTGIHQLSSLPAEIQDIIFNSLTFHERLRFSAVCSSWRSLILNWSGMWTSLSTEYGHNISPDFLPYIQYIRGPDVKRLHLSDYGKVDEIRLCEITSFLVDLKCNRIEHVEILSVSSVINESGFLRLTKLCGNTITRIVLDILATESTIITPDQVLLRCPNLEKLYYTAMLEDKQPWISTFNDFEHPRLVDLCLTTGTRDGGFDPTPFLTAAPKLQRLALNFNDIGQIGPILPSLIRQYCPQLTALLITGFEDGGTLCSQDADWTIREHPQPSGLLEELTLHDSFGDHRYACDILREIVSESYNSIKVLNLANHELYGGDTLQYLSSFVFPFMTRIILDYGQVGVPEPLCQLFTQSTPNLISLSLHNISYANDTLLQSIASGVESLEKMELKHCNEITSNGLVKFLESMCRTLRTIFFYGMSAVTPEVLDAIATKYRVIDELAIEYCNRVTIQDMGQFFEKPCFGHSVRKLDLIFTHWPSDIVCNNDTVEQVLEKVDEKALKWSVKIQPDRTVEDWPYYDYCHTKFRARRKTSPM